MLRSILWALALLAIAPSAKAAPPPDLRGAAEALRVAHAVPAIGLGVIDRGRIVFLGGLGEVAGRAATEHDRFRAASISKLFTAQAIMRLAEERRLTLDDDVGRWLPDFAGRGLTIRLLLAHRSGFRDAIFPLETDEPARVQAYLKILAAQPPARPPGEAFAYTDADYNVLGAVIEAASGVAYEAYVRTALIDRLKLLDADIFPRARRPREPGAAVPQQARAAAGDPAGVRRRLRAQRGPGDQRARPHPLDPGHAPARSPAAEAGLVRR